MFSRYEIYTTVCSVYCYDDTNVLKNKLNIRDLEQLKKVETEITSIKQFSLLENPISGTFSQAHLMKIHKFLFGDLYTFAGKIRTEQIGKADTWFYPPQNIQTALDKVFTEIKEKKSFKGLAIEQLFDRLAYVMAELNIIHPFREGNGRAIREFIRCLALHNGYVLNWGNVDKTVILDKSIESVDDYTALIPVLVDCISGVYVDFDYDEAIVSIARQVNDYRIARVRLCDIDNFHRSNKSGGVSVYSSRPVLYGLTWCDKIDGEIGHSCLHGTAPHNIKVAVIKKYTDKKVVKYIERIAALNELLKNRNK